MENHDYPNTLIFDYYLFNNFIIRAESEFFWFGFSHRKLDGGRRSNLCDITGTAL